MPDGRIELRQVERFREIGRWLKKHGQTIYATRGGPLPSASWGGMTQRENLIFMHALQWPGERLMLPALPQKIIASSVVTGGKVTVNQTDAGVEVFVPPGDRQELDTIVLLKLDARAADTR